MTIYTADVIYPMDGLPIRDGAVAVEAGRIVAVGQAAELLNEAGPTAEVVTLPGQAIIPGMIDAHHHLSIALLYEAAVNCRPEQAPGIEAILSALRAAGSTLPPDEGLVGYGYDPWRLLERRHPTRADLDAACPDRPVVLIHYSFHEAVVNSRALNLLGYDRYTPDPPGGVIERDRRGQLTGRLVETAMAPAEGYARRALVERNSAAFFEGLEQYQGRLLAAGITRIADPVVPPDLQQLYRLARQAGRLQLPVVMMPVAPGGQISTLPDWLGGGATAKLLFDGGERCAMCFSLTQVAEMAALTLGRALGQRSLGPLRALTSTQLSLNRHLHLEGGQRFYPPARGLAVAEAAVARGFGLAIHAIGNHGIAQALDTLAALRPRHPDATPPRLEHGTFITPELARRAAATGVTVVSQPLFLTLADHDDIPPMPRGLRILGHRTLLEAGVRIAGSSDYPVADFDPLQALRAAVTRTTPAGMRLHPEEALDPEEVLAMYTREAARALGCLDVTGTLTPGKRADLLVLSHDPCDRTRLGDLRVVTTILAGNIVYAAHERKDADDETRRPRAPGYPLAV
jgi:predicted amidohydrolase YtcJ